MDLDQGGLPKQWQLTALGPSIGWVPGPGRASTFPITAGGTYNIDLAMTYITVNTTGSVTVVLPSAANPGAGAIAVPGPFIHPPIVVADIGGNALAHPITIQAAVTDTINGLASIQITTNYGSVILSPNTINTTWNTP